MTTTRHFALTLLLIIGTLGLNAFDAGAENIIYVKEKAADTDAENYTIDRVIGPITITLEGNTTSNASLTHGIRLSIDNGQLTIDNEMANAVDVAVYTITGQTFVLLRELRGSRTLALPAGVYIVRAGTQTWKVIVND